MGTLSSVMRNTGILLAYIVGALLDYSQTPYVFICLPLLFVINFWFLPSTPQYLIRRGHLEVIHFTHPIEIGEQSKKKNSRKQKSP